METSLDAAVHTSPAPDEEVQLIQTEAAAVVDNADSSHGVELKRANDAKLLFGNGKLNQWLSARRSYHKKAKLKTLDSWLSPSKTPIVSSPWKSPSVSRARVTCPSTPPQRTGIADINLESSDLCRSPSTDIRKYFHVHVVPQSSTEELDRRDSSKSDSGVDGRLEAVTVVDLVEDSPPGIGSEQISEQSECETVVDVCGTSAEPTSWQHSTSAPLTSGLEPTSETSGPEAMSELSGHKPMPGAFGPESSSESSGPETTSGPTDPETTSDPEPTYETTDSELASGPELTNETYRPEIMTSRTTDPETTSALESVSDLASRTSDAEPTCESSGSEPTSETCGPDITSGMAGPETKSSGTCDRELCLDWCVTPTSRTKSSTRRGPFKRSLGLVHFTNEVRWSVTVHLFCLESCVALTKSFHEMFTMLLVL